MWIAIRKSYRLGPIVPPREGAAEQGWEPARWRGARHGFLGLGLLAVAGCGAPAEVNVDLGVARDGPPDLPIGGRVCPDGGPRPETGLFQRERMPCPYRWCSRLSSGDLDGDGDLDFLVYADGPTVFKNDGRGRFTKGVSLAISERDHLLADWDGDGDLDILAVLADDAYGVVVYENRGGAFIERERILSGVIPMGGPFPPPDTGGADVRAIGVGDLDGKPPIDLLMSAHWELGFRLRGLNILFRDGVQKRYAWPIDFGNPFDRLEFVDVDRDGIKDLVYAYRVSRRAGVVYGTRGRDWGLVKDEDLLEPWGDRFFYFGAADLDKDGLIDVVGIRPPLLPGGEDLVVTERQVAPRAWASTAYCSGRGTWSGGLSDLNGDGAPDVVFSMWENGQIGFLLNRGNGKFWPLRIADTKGGNLTSMVLGDFDGDGRQDILHTEGAPSPESIVLLRNLGKW